MNTRDHDGVSLTSNLDECNQRALRCATDFFHTERRPPWPHQSRPVVIDVYYC
jgi:hypothetical protein